MIRINPKLCGLVVVGLVAGVLFGVLPAAADSWVTLENGYITVAIGQSGEWPDPLKPLHRLDECEVPGRFGMWTTGGDPYVEEDDWMRVVYTAPWRYAPGDRWGAWQVMVDTWSTDEDREHVWANFEMGGTSGIWGDADDGNWELVPYVPTNENVIRGIWYPTPENGTSPTTGDDVEVESTPIRCRLEVRLMRGTAQFKWDIKNEDVVDHMIGLRAYADTLSSGEDTGTIDLRNIVSIPGRGIIEDRTVLFGKEIPSVLEMVNSQTDPAFSVRATFRGNDATPPDVVGIDEWPTVAGHNWTYGYGDPSQVTDWFNTWQYEPIPHYPITDLGYGAFWKPRRVAPGQTLTIVHYLGLGCATSDFTKPNIDRPQYGATVQGPRALKYWRELDIGRLHPRVFEIRADFENIEKYIDFQWGSFTLNLPPELTLDESEGGKYTKTVYRIDAESEESVTWKVRPVPYPNGGIVDYSVSFSAAPVGGTAVRRTINIPATEWQQLSRGWEMIAVPFHLTNTDPQTALGLPPGTVMWRYDTYRRRYEYATRLAPGEAYWLNLSQAQWTAMTPGDYSPIPWAETRGYQIPLDTGWNLVGNPYVYTVTLGELRFYYRDYGVLDYDEAVARGLISRTLFWWDPVFHKYNWSSRREVQVKPWQGYWMKVLRPGVTMIITPISQLGAALGGEPVEPIDDGDQPPPLP